MKKLRNSMNYNPADEENSPRSFSPLSLTIPDQTMSIRTLIERHTRGLPIVGNNSIPQYDPEPILDGINIKTLDLSELNDLKDALASERDAILTKHKDELSSKEKKAQKEALKREIEDELKLEELNKNKPTEIQ
ncbi:MAG: hypothetical protein [Microvirus sp.]|nr:MAG: hypothetical protein [Microvirus sp.]